MPRSIFCVSIFWELPSIQGAGRELSLFNFNHVPAKGTTMTFLMRHFGLSISILIPAKGTTIYISAIHASAWISIHVPAKGTTMQKSLKSRYLNGFQSTFPRRERRQNKQFPPSIFRHFHLNIRTPCLHCALFSLFHLQTHPFCAFFLVRISQSFYVHFGFALHN